MTERLFYEDSHLDSFTAKVTACVAKGGSYGVVLDRTAFFPEGGGQYADTGFLNALEVMDVQEEDCEIYHFISQPLEAGTKVHGRINAFQRFVKMQQHTGEHIVSGLVHKHFGFDNVGFHLGTEESTLDFNGFLTEENLRKIEKEANEAVVSNLKVEIFYPSQEDRADLEYRSKIQIDTDLRIVRIPGYDVCACCAPHVVYTGEIGIIKLVGASKYKGGTRVRMLCGFRALEDYNKKEKNITEISGLLSAKPYETADAVRHVQKELMDAKQKGISFQNKYLDLKFSNLDKGLGHFLFFDDHMDMNLIRKYINEGMDHCNGICGAFVGNDNNGYNYIFGSKTIDLRNLLKEFHQIFPGKGGGRPEMVQGSVSGNKNQLQQYINQIPIPTL